MRAIVTIFDEKTGHVFEKDKILEPYREQRDPYVCSTMYEYRFQHSVMDEYFKMLFDQQIVEPNEELLKTIDRICPNPGYTLSSEDIHKALDDTEKVNACSECEFFSDSRFYADNSILVSWGSCMKCQRNMTTTNPYQETPSWCPLKGDEDE